MNQWLLRLAILGIVSMAHDVIQFDASIAQAKPAESSTGRTDSIQPINDRFHDGMAKEIPDFQKHIVPLLGKLGCNGRACHGSFQGRGGFQLSLFGYDFNADHSAILDPSTGRVDLDIIDESLILTKPLDADSHEGGQRFKKNSWEHHVLKKWILGGAQHSADQPKRLLKLDVHPSSVEFESTKATDSLKVFAHWEDGSIEDVTILCRFKSNDTSIASVSDQGTVTSHLPGDTHIVVSYDNAVIPIPVLLPFEFNKQPEPTKSNHQIDQLVDLKLRKLNIQASGLCTDSEFIRRVSLDITGILPSASRVEEFLNDADPTKRSKLIDDLLGSEGYSAWWATRFSDWTGNTEEQLNNALPVRNVAARMWYEWLRKRIDQNVPYDEIVQGIVTAESRNQDESYLDYCKEMSRACQPGQASHFANREGLPLFWARRNFQTPEDRAIGFSYTFLGVRIECAQCHKHPFDQWSKDDFKQFATLFSPIKVNQNLVAADAKKERSNLINNLTGDKKLRGSNLRQVLYLAAKQDKTIPFGELLVNVRELTDKRQKSIEAAKRQGRKLKAPTIPSGKILGRNGLIMLDHDPRRELMEWLRDPENPYFAKAIVNRVWSNYFGIGIVNPTDDMNLANPPSNGPLMEYLANEFIKSGFNLKWLHRTITTSHTYQRSVQTNDSNDMDLTNFSHHVPRRLPAEVIFDAVRLATGSDENADQLREEISSMAIADGQTKIRNQQEFALEVFGQSTRNSNCDCDRSDAPSLLQSVYLRNDTEIHDRLIDSKGWVYQVCKELEVAPPSAANSSQREAAFQRGMTFRKQLISQVERFLRGSEAQQAKSRKQIRSAFNRATEKIEKLGYQTPSMAQLFANPQAWSSLEPIAAKPASRDDLKALVHQSYLRTLSRYPDPDEETIAVDYILNSESSGDGVASLVWALVNTKEFIVSH